MAGICYVAPDIAVPSARGASTHILELSAALAESGDEVHVISNRLAGQKQTEELRKVMFHRVYRWPKGIVSTPGSAVNKRTGDRSTGFGSLGYRMYLQTVNAARIGSFAARVMRRYGLDAVLERETAFGAGAFASLMTGRPLLLEVIGPRSSPLSLSRCFRLLAYSPLMVPSEFRSKAEYVEAAVNTEVFKVDLTARRRVRERLGIDGETVVGYVGTFQAFHGVSDLIKAAALALRRRTDLKFLLVGPHTRSSADLAGELGITKDVIFVGPVEYEDVPSYINASDILVAPYNTAGTDRETQGIGSPLKVLEYMAVGKPTIGSSLPQMRAIIRDGWNGRLFPEGDYTAMAEIVLELAESREKRDELGRNGLATVTQKYGWSLLANRINDLIREQTSAS